MLSFKIDSIGFTLHLRTLIVKLRLYQNDFDCGLESGIMKRMGVFFVVVLLHVCTVITVVVSCRFVDTVQYLQYRYRYVIGEPRQKKAELEEGNLWRSFLSKEPISMKE